MSDQRKLTARDMLSFILTGDNNGDGYDFDDEQLKRAEIMLTTIMEARMTAALQADVPPMSDIERRLRAGYN